MPTAHDLLLAVQPFGVRGLTIRDETNPSTWTLEGSLTADQRTQALAVLAALLQPTASAPSAATFWPPDLTPLEQDVAALKKTVLKESD